MKKFIRIALISATMVVAGNQTNAGIPVFVDADMTAERENFLNIFRWGKDLAQGMQQILALKQQIEQMDDFVADVIGDATDIIEWVNSLSGPWGPEMIVGSDAYKEYLRMRNELDKLKHWKISVDPKFKFDTEPAPNTHPTLDKLMARYEVGTKYLNDCVNANDKPATELMERIAKMNNRRYVRKAGKTTNGMLGYMMQQLGNIAAAESQQNMLNQASAKDKIIREAAEVEAERAAAEAAKAKREADFARKAKEDADAAKTEAVRLNNDLQFVKFKEPPSIVTGH